LDLGRSRIDGFADAGAGAGAGVVGGVGSEVIGLNAAPSIGADVANGDGVAGGRGATVDAYGAAGAGAPANVPNAGPGPPTAGPQFPPTHGIGKSSHVSQCVQPVDPIARATAVSRRLNLNIPVSFP